MRGLHDEYRLNNKIYANMLQKYFPNYFRDIPWQQTGRPAAPLKNLSISVKAFKYLAGFSRKVTGIKSTQEYTDYPEWIRGADVANNLSKILDPRSAFYRHLTSDDLKQKWLAPHLTKRYFDNSDKILRAATIELYFRKALK